MLDSARDALPLRVIEIVHNDPNIVVRGDTWALSILCDWRLRSSSAEVSSDQDLLEEIDALFSELIGQSLVYITALDEDMTDPELTFTGDLELTLVADSDWDPWVLRIPGATLVGHKAL